jgi:hypothetical protein
MSLSCPYRFAIAMYAEDGTSLGTAMAKRDWEPAYEWTRFYHQRKGTLSLSAYGGASLLPIWDDAAGEPYCRGYRVQVEEAGRPVVASDFSIEHFREHANSVASVFVEQGKLRAGERYTYIVVAYPGPSEAAPAGGLTVTDASPRVPARAASLQALLDRAEPSGVMDPLDMPVFVSREVLEQAALQTRAHEGCETGGILIGKLGWDAEAGEIFVEITAQIPAEHTIGNSVKLTFTPQTWAAADAALRLRQREEVYAGWLHSHPVAAWCRARSCTLEAQRNCRLAKDFFSADDEAVMRAAFPRAWCVAIVANDTAFTDLTFSMFGNRKGIMQPRGFYVLEGN